jgi:hypothetical protein
VLPKKKKKTLKQTPGTAKTTNKKPFRFTEKEYGLINRTGHE